MSIELIHGPGYELDPEIYLSEVLLKLHGINKESVCNFCSCCSNFVRLTKDDCTEILAVGCYSNAWHQKQLSIVKGGLCDHACQEIKTDDMKPAGFDHGFVDPQGFHSFGNGISPRRSWIKII